MPALSNSEKAEIKARLLSVLTRHPGRGRAIGMGELYEAVYGRPYSNRINGTRALRTLVTELRRDGVPICSTADQAGGGYYLASAGSDLDDYCRRLRSQGLRKLVLEAKLRRLTLPCLLNEIQLRLNSEMNS